MRTVGRRIQYSVCAEPSAENLLAGARWNTDMQRLAPNFRLPIKRGVYRFKSHEEADAAWQGVLALGIADQATRR